MLTTRGLPIAATAIVHDAAQLSPDLQVGDFSIIGHPGPAAGCVRTGRAVKIGCYTIVGADVNLADGVEIDHYCRIGEGTEIGPFSRILYGAKIYDNVRIGANCIVAGELADDTVLESDVTFMGRVSHTYRAPVGPKRWDDPASAQASPIIKARSVVGEGALLIGAVSIGPCSYVAAGEFVRCDVPPESVLLNGEITPLAQWKGFIRVREPEGL